MQIYHWGHSNESIAIIDMARCLGLGVRCSLLTHSNSTERFGRVSLVNWCIFIEYNSNQFSLLQMYGSARIICSHETPMRARCRVRNVSFKYANRSLYSLFNGNNKIASLNNHSNLLTKCIRKAESPQPNRLLQSPLRLVLEKYADIFHGTFLLFEHISSRRV